MGKSMIQTITIGNYVFKTVEESGYEGSIITHTKHTYK